MSPVQYHYQGRILEADDSAVSHAGHCLKIKVDKGYHYVWPEQVIKNGVPVQDPYRIPLKGTILHPEQFSSTAPRERRVKSEAKATPTDLSPVAGGDITLASVCQELAVEPSLARRILRKHWSRPGSTWTFTTEQAVEVKTILVREIKG